MAKTKELVLVDGSSYLFRAFTLCRRWSPAVVSPPVR